MAEADAPELSRWRSIFWPIYRHELKKFVPIVLIAFLISFSYNILRPLKDTIVMNAKGSGAEVIPFIKVWVMFPAAILTTVVFAWLSRRVSRDTMFYAMMSLFLTFYALFVFILLPLGDRIHLHGVATILEGYLPVGGTGFINMIRYWSLSCFYAMCELWGSAIFFLCFWSFVNEVTLVSEAKRFYGILGAVAHASGIAAGFLAASISRMEYQTWLPLGSTGNSWEQKVKIFVSMVLVAGCLCMLLYWWIQRKVLTDPNLYCPEKAAARQKKKNKVTVTESVSFLRQSSYFRNIAIIVLTYNVIINLVEVIWKHQVQMLYPDKAQFNEYMSNVTLLLGVTATCAALFISSTAIRRLGWTMTAMITPFVLLGTSFLFFGSFIWKEHFASAYVALEALNAVVFFGTLQNVMSRGAKYTVYDATKELAFVPLSDEAKLKGKTTIDGLGTRGGKAGGSLIHQGLLIICGSLSASAPYIGMILLGMIVVWMLAVLRLGRAFTALTEGQVSEEEVLNFDENNEALAPQKITVRS